ncbi:MAG: type II toxin-antitoxin system PemK/MazF family toxin [Alphaproteobacteria bacterium]|nr:type II toxin-antitoxin system PemK/MazF family toxin [Alphaproteobacteria bacterium]
MTAAIQTPPQPPDPLDEGDLVWVDFDPARGREQSGFRPAIVVSPRLYNETRGTTIVCPITRNLTPWPTKVFLPEGLAVDGAVLTELVRAVDREHRGFRKVGTAPPDVLREVRLKLKAVLGMEGL